MRQERPQRRVLIDESNSTHKDAIGIAFRSVVTIRCFDPTFDRDTRHDEEEADAEAHDMTPNITARVTHDNG